MDESFIERFSKKGLELLRIKEIDNQIYYLKCKLGLELLLLNLSKLIIVCSVAAFLKVTVPVLIFIASFLLIRMYAQGAHAHSSLKCTILSVILLVGIPFSISNGILVSRGTLVLVSLVNYIIIFLYAPSDTKKNPIDNLQTRKKMKKRAVLAYTLVSFSHLLPLTIEAINLIVLGAFTASLLLTPKAHEIL